MFVTAPHFALIHGHEKAMSVGIPLAHGFHGHCFVNACYGQIERRNLLDGEVGVEQETMSNDCKTLSWADKKKQRRKKNYFLIFRQSLSSRDSFT